MSVGKRIATGRLRVDASRAVSKLRDYQLSDPRTWPREVVRAASALGATGVRAFGDADDVWITWEGEPPAMQELQSILNELVSPSAASERRGLRLLAIGVNTALGLGPRWVDLYSLSPDGTSRVRYTAKVLEPKDLGEDGLGSEAVTQVSKPHPKLYASGGAVHFRRYPGFEALRLFVRGAEPPELTDLRWACRNLPIPHEVGDERLLDNTKDIVRVELGMGLNGFVALVAGEPPHRGVVLDFAELGVHLAQRATQEGVHHAPPLRLYLDAPRLPTNASRSEVRIDDSPVRDAVDRLGQVMPTLVEKIIAQWEEKPTPELRFAIIRLISAYASGSQWFLKLDDVPEVFRPLLELAVLKNGVGDMCSFNNFQNSFEIVHTGTVPEPSALHPWLHNVLWAAPNFAETQLLGDWPPATADDYIRQARQNLKAWEQWYAQKSTEPKVEREPDQWVTIDVGGVHYPSVRANRLDLEWDGLTGQVAVYDTSRPREGHVRLHLEGRPIADVMLRSAIPFRAVLEVPGLQPTPDYKSVVNDETYDRAVKVARAAAVAAVELLAGKLRDDSRTLPASVDMRDLKDFDDFELLRRAQIALVVNRIGSAPEPAEIEKVFDRGPLSKVKCWPVVHHPKRMQVVTIRELFAIARKQPDLICVTPDAIAAPRGREAIVTDAEQRAHLRALLGSPNMILYSPPDREVKARDVAIGSSLDGVTLYISESSRRGGVAYSPGSAPLLRRFHGGRYVDQRSYDFAFVPVSIGVDDDGIVPGTSTTLDPILPFDPKTWEAKWLCALVDHIRGEEQLDFFAPSNVLESRGLRTALLMALGRSGARRALTKERMEALMDLPLVTRVRAEAVSLRQIKSGSRLEYLLPNEAGGLALGDWSPIEADEQLADAIASIIGRNLHHATARLDAIREKAVRVQALQQHRTRAKREMPPAGQDGVELSGKCRGVVKLSRTDQMHIEVRLEERPFAQLTTEDGYPVEAVVDIPAKYTRRDLKGLSREGEKLVRSAVRRAVPRILIKLAEESPQRLVDEAAPAMLLLRWLRNSKRSKARSKLFEAPIFKSVHGERVSVKDACTKQRIRVGRFEGKWVGPAEGESEHLLDGAILELPEGKQRAALKEAYEALAHPRKVLDHSRALRELQTERRVAQNLVVAPTLPDIPDTLKATLTELRKTSRRRLIGVGEVGLIKGDKSKIRVYANSELVGEVSFDLQPAVCIATESLSLAEAIREDKKVKADKQARSLLRALLIEKVLGTLGSQPRWVVRAVRRAFGEGIITRDELRGASVFETTSDQWFDFQVLVDQQERFGDVWYTTDDRISERKRQPLDPRRFAFRVTDSEAITLMDSLIMVDASEELRLDERARRNRARPTVEAFELPASLRDVILGAHHWQHDGTEILVGVLPASHAAYSGIHVHRDRRLVCIRRTTGWPVVAFVEDPALTINRTWDDVVEDKAYKALEARVRKRALGVFEEILDAPDNALVAFRPDVSYIKKHLSEIQGAHCVVWVDAQVREGTVAVHSRRQQTIVPTKNNISIPISGVMHLAHVTHGQRERLEMLIARLYGELAGRLVHKIVAKSLDDARVDSAIAHVVLAVGSGCWEPSKRARGIKLSCFHPEPKTLGDLDEMLEAREPIDAFHPNDLHPERPGLVRDGSETARAVEEVLGKLIRSRRVELALPRIRRDRKQPNAEFSAPVEVPLQALGARLLSRIAALGYAHVARGIVVIPDEKAELIQLRSDERLMLAGNHPVLLKLEAARISRSADFEPALDMLALHAIAEISRRSEDVTDGSVNSTLMRLLRSKS